MPRRQAGAVPSRGAQAAADVAVSCEVFQVCTCPRSLASPRSLSCSCFASGPPTMESGENPLTHSRPLVFLHTIRKAISVGVRTLRLAIVIAISPPVKAGQITSVGPIIHRSCEQPCLQSIPRRQPQTECIFATICHVIKLIMTLSVVILSLIMQ